MQFEVEIVFLKNHIRSQPPKQMKSSGVEAAINGEDRKVNNAYNTNPMLVTCHNATDIFISKSTTDTIWNMESSTPRHMHLSTGIFTGSSCSSTLPLSTCPLIRVITKLPNSEQSYKEKVKTHNYINTVRIVR
jgi:hypothetical protein